MSWIYDLLLIFIVICGIVSVVLCIKNLYNVRKKNNNKTELDKSYSYLIIIALLYILFWFIKLKQ